MQEKYYATIECVDRFGKAIKDIEVFSEYGKRPTIGSYVEAFRKLGHAMEIKDLVDLVFKPVHPHESSIFSFRVVRVIKASD